MTSILWNVLINILTEGIAQPMCAAIVAFAVCPLGAFLIAIGAFIRKGLRDAWDAILFQVFCALVFIWPINRIKTIILLQC